MIKEELMRQQTNVFELMPELYLFEPFELSCLLYEGENNFRSISKPEQIDGNDSYYEEYDFDPEFKLKRIRDNEQKLSKLKKKLMNKNQEQKDETWGVHSNPSHLIFEALIQTLGSEEQVESYLMSPQNETFIGWYAQTELGHGINIK